PLSDAPPDPRPEQLLRPPALVLRGERLRRHRRPIHHAAGRHLRAPPLDDGVAHLVAGVQVVDDRVGRERRRAQPLQGGQGGRLARPEAARQTDEWDSLLQLVLLLRVVREDVLGEPERRHVVEVARLTGGRRAALVLGAAGGRAIALVALEALEALGRRAAAALAGQHLALHALDRER